MSGSLPIHAKSLPGWIEVEERNASPYDAISDLIGVAHGGRTALSEKTSASFTQLLKDRRRQR